MIHILFCGNAGVFDGILSAMLSILMRSDTRRAYIFYLYTMDVAYIKPSYVPITDKQRAYLESIAREYHSENRVVLTDVTALYKKWFAGCPNEGAYCSPYTLIRLFADLTADMPDKLLYLDADILLNRDIGLLYDTDIAGYEYAAALDHYGKFLIHPHYINAGVLLMNLKYMKEMRTLEKARMLIRTKKLVFADQSALIRATTRRKVLPQRFNDQKFLHRHTVVRHFSKRLFYWPYPHTENIKQWHVSRVHKVFRYYAFDDILYEYLYRKRRFDEEV